MTLDEDAAKVVEHIRDEMTSVSAKLLSQKNPQLLGEKWYERIMQDHIAAFGRRCAEAMREECAKVCHGQQSNAACIEAIRQVEVK